MKLLDELRSEHVRIERLVGSLRTFADRFLTGAAGPEDGLEILRVLSVYAGGFHHDREELVLFPALENDASLPRRGPIEALLDDHHETAALLAAMKDELASAAPDANRFREAAVRDSHILWLHIDAENSVLFPESEARLARVGIRELESRPATAEEIAAAESADQLALLYPPLEDPEVIRGEGCALCPRYGDSCDGIERAWWNEYEWEEMDDHIAAS
ncbi:MAG TPA: hemerythrin domain-containing protein [Thermoanaerobaculia bacterium]